MRLNRLKIVSSLFLITALCGCTTQSVNNAKEIEESNTYIYKYEYETGSDGQVETQYHEEKPSFDDFGTVKAETVETLKNKNGSLKFVRMNEVYNWGGMECSVTEAHISTYVDYAYEILDDDVVELVIKQLKKSFPSGRVEDGKRKMMWVKVHIKNPGLKDQDLNMKSSNVEERIEGIIRPGGGALSLIDQELWLKGEAPHRGTVRIKANCEQDLWYVFDYGSYNTDYKYYMLGSFGYIFDPSDYSGILIELNDVKDEG